MYNAFSGKRRGSGLVVKLLRILPGKFSGEWRVGLGGELSFGGWFVGPIPVGPCSVKKPESGIR
jgi:hypothetical protein